ncbi:O-antigen ligase family protein [Gimesia aquarii]|uniref:O-Antigen ligase n=1 Tax=Gimesia aquarii TaxID=2527964 RepID=A0A517W1A1_9PLAN|nr:O-antigen ligase family protein [Gimesia aquarii]QDT99016.1 O-Antigen ligase [Gimesia aquarii]
MSKRRKQHRSQSSHTKSSPAAPELHPLLSLLTGVQLFLVGTLITTRYLLPAESAPQGDTLHIALGWFIVAILFCSSLLLDRYRTPHLDRYDFGVWLLVSGQVIAALVMILITDGQKRAALNLMWEWVSLGLSFSLIRRIIATTQLRTVLLQGLLTTIVLLSVYGIWQHHWMYGQLAEEYLSARQQFDTATTPAERSEFQKKLLSMGVPADALSGSGQQLFERRLLDSTEPLGMFALANTFAGLLAVGFLIAFSQTVHALFDKTRHVTSKGSRFKSWILLLPTILIGYCLILTKSRTAWVGVVGGLVSLGILKLIRHKEQSQAWKKHAIKWGSMTGIILLGFFLLATFSGGFDKEVLTEAPKSLKYRLEWWTATWDLIKESPLWGTGPGNFREHYLKYKLPGSSEEIADPHNLFLDVWANGGMIAFAGLLTVLMLACYHWVIKPSASSNESKTEIDSFQNEMSTSQVALLLGFIFAFPFLWGIQLFLQSIDETLLWIFCLGWLVLYFVLNLGWKTDDEFQQMEDRSSLLSLSLAAGFVALSIHLLGAGGIAMPAITQTWFLLLALAVPVTCQQAHESGILPLKSSSGKSRPLKSIHLKTLLLFVCLLMIVFFVWSSFAPTIHRKRLVIKGEQALLRGRSAQSAQRFFRQATQTDPLSPGPWQALAQIYFNQWAQSEHDDRDAFDQGVKQQKEAIKRNPFNPLNYFELGQKFFQQYQVSKTQADLTDAIENLSLAVTGYPNNARYRAVLAEVLFEAGQLNESQGEARQAINLDEANHQAQHIDKYLTEKTLNKMKEIINLSHRNQN